MDIFDKLKVGDILTTDKNDFKIIRRDQDNIYMMNTEYDKRVFCITREESNSEMYNNLRLK